MWKNEIFAKKRRAMGAQKTIFLRVKIIISTCTYQDYTYFLQQN